ncbi:MAG TPA: M56 family metallopeptidase [Longimicrobiaceae bacterium]|nr:M56 family metallopeptidase [Longimicrobiaceae bacterium]
MSTLFDLLARAVDAPPAFVAGVVVKGTLLLLAAGAASLVLRRASAAARHLVWSLAVVGLLALPVLSLAVPGWDVPVPELRTAPGPVTLPPVLALPPREEATAPIRAADFDPEGSASDLAAPILELTAPAASPGTTPTPAAGGGLSAPSPAMPVRSLWEWVLAAWALGCLGVLGRLALGQLGVGLLARRAQPVRDLRWTVLLAELAAELGVRRPVRLLRSPRGTMPITWGVLCPAILLPAGADAWPEARRRVVLLHELAHVARRDCLTQLLAGVACALYWFHPLAWHAARRLRAERELACDDCVLGVGTPAREYAGHLLEVARSFRSGRVVGAAAIAMARPSQLEGRLLAVLDGVRDRRSPSRGARLGAGAAALLLLLPLAALRAAETPSPAEAAPATAQGTEFERRIPARSGGTLYLDLRHDIDVRVEGWDREEVWVRVDPPTPERRDTRLEVEGVPDGVRVAALRMGGVAHRDTRKLEVRVPHRFSVAVESEGGGVQLSGLEGRFTGRTRGGGLHLEHLRGEARLATSGGGAMISGSRLEGTLLTGGAGVLLQGSPGRLDIRTEGGAIVGGEAAETDPDPYGDPDLEVDCAGSDCSLTLLQDGKKTEGNGFAYVTGDDSGSRRQSVEALARNAPPAAAVAALARIAFEDRDVEVQREAAESLGDLPGDHGTPELVRIARSHPAEEVRREAAEALGAKGSNAAIAALREMVDRDRDPNVQLEAVESLAATYAHDDAGRRTSPRQVREMLDRIARTHPRAAVRARAAEALEDLDREGDGGTLAGPDAQDDPASERIPVSLAPDAARFGDPRALPALRAAARDRHLAVRGAAAPALARLADQTE